MGGCLALFCFLLIRLASFFNIALIANQILSLWYGKTMCQPWFFLSCLAKSQKCWLKKFSLSFISLFWTAQEAWSKACAIFISFSQDYKYICVYIYIYIHIYIYHMINFLLPFCCLAEILARKRGVFCLILFSFCLVLLQSSMHNKCTSCLYHYSCTCFQILSPNLEITFSTFPSFFLPIWPAT